MTQANTPTSAAEIGAQPHEVRAWAREQGYEVSNAGRISGEVLAAYAAAKGR